MNEFKPCPFCGGEASLYVSGLEQQSIACIHCKKCGAAANTYTTKEVAIEAWNTRAEPAAYQRLYEAAKGLSCGEDWNNGVHAKRHGYRQKLIEAVRDINACRLFKEPAETECGEPKGE